MRRVNIRSNGTIVTISFQTKGELVDYLNNRGFANISNYTADKVWDLNVGTSFKVLDFIISIQSKARAGNHLVL